MAADSKNEVLKKPELPDVQTLERVVKKHHERREYLRILRSTVASLLVVAAAAVIISMYCCREIQIRRWMRNLVQRRI